MKKFLLFGMILFCSFLAVIAGNTERKVVHYDVDPPVVIDGDLSDWEDIPELANLSGAGKLARNRASERYKYSGDRDLSAVLKVAWRPDGLKIAGAVKDNIHVQNGGDDTWAGDHLDLRLDMFPETAKKQELFGEGQFQFLLSPGDFKKIPPQIQVIHPEGMPLKGGRIAAVKTSDGYRLEAWIPWSELNCGKVDFNRMIALDILVSDCDRAEEKQQKIKVVGSLPLSPGRSRLQHLVLADGNGKYNAAAPELQLSGQEGTVKRDQPYQLSWDLTAEDLKQKTYLLEFEARADFRTPGGYAMGMLNVEVNDTMLGVKQLFGMADNLTMRNGENLALINSSGALTLPWSPDYKAIDSHPRYSIPDRRMCVFRFNLSGLLKPGRNRVVFKIIPNRHNAQVTLKVGTVKLLAHPAGTLVDPTRPPVGELPVYMTEPPRNFPLYKDLEVRRDQISFRLGNDRATLQSEFMTAGSPWGDLSGSAIRHQRQIEQLDQYILVRDKFTNTGKEIAAVLQRHTVKLDSGIRKIFINGSEFSTRYYAERVLNGNSTVIALAKNTAVGMIPWSDALSVHGVGAAANGNIQLADYTLAIAPQTEYTAEFILVPWDRSDYWSWINQARRIVGANFPITLMTGFWLGDAATRFSAADQRSMIRNLGLNAVIQSNNCARDSQGLELRGGDWINSPLTEYHAMRKNLDQWYPDKSVRQLVYFHCFLETTPENIRRYHRDLIRLADGKTTVYGTSRGNSHLHCILPGGSGWGKVAEEWIDCILDRIKADGIFWDEFSASNVKYAYNADLWDNVSADIDRNSGKVLQRKSSVTLLTQPWRQQMVNKIRKQNKCLIINGAPLTQTMRRMQIQTMFETGNISSLNGCHLSSPVALGDHLTEKNFADAWKVMLRALDFGALYCAYYTHKIYPRDHQAMSCWMYPFTPLELHSGYVIGKERIITRISGRFGWGDHSDFEAKVFDADGRLTDKYPVEKIVRGRQTFAEVRIPADYAAVIVRK